MKRVAIIGGGIGGLATAIALRRAGIEADVYERSPHFGEVGAGITLWPNATRILLDLGVGEAIVARGRRFPESELLTATGVVLARTSVRDIEEYFDAPCIALHRAELHRALVDALPARGLFTGAVCQGVATNGDRATATFADGRTVDADLIVGADGIRSVVRSAVQPRVTPRYAGYTGWRGIATGIALDSTLETWGHGLRFGIVPLLGDRVYWFATRNAAAGTKIEPAQLKKMLLELFASWHYPIVELIRHTAAEAILQNDIYDIAPFSPWSKGRIVLLGDSAHATTPNLGQGACMAIESAAALAEELTRTESVTDAIRGFEKRRHARAATINKESRRVGTVGQWQNGVAVAIRDAVMRAVPATVTERHLRSVIAQPY